jgi:hypothetical protein
MYAGFAGKDQPTAQAGFTEQRLSLGSLLLRKHGRHLAGGCTDYKKTAREMPDSYCFASEIFIIIKGYPYCKFRSSNRSWGELAFFVHHFDRL